MYGTISICVTMETFSYFSSLQIQKGGFTLHCIPDYNTKGNFGGVSQWTGNSRDLWGENVPSAACFLTCLTGTEGWEHYSSVLTYIQNLAKTLGCAYITHANHESIHSYIRVACKGKIAPPVTRTSRQLRDEHRTKTSPQNESISHNQRFRGFG